MTPLIAYNVVDVELKDGVDWPGVQKSLTTIEEVLSSRFILGETPLGGYGYAVNHPGELSCSSQHE